MDRSRSLSISRATFLVLEAEARRRGLCTGRFVEDGIRRALGLPPLKSTPHRPRHHESLEVTQITIDAAMVRRIERAAFDHDTSYLTMADHVINAALDAAGAPP